MSLNMGKDSFTCLYLFSFCCSKNLMRYVLFVLVLMLDVTTTMIIKPGPLIDFVIANQGARDPFTVDWSKVFCFVMV